MHWFILLLILVPESQFFNSYFMKFILNEIKSTALSIFHINSAAISLGIPDHLLTNANSSVSQMAGTHLHLAMKTWSRKKLGNKCDLNDSELGMAAGFRNC